MTDDALSHFDAKLAPVVKGIVDVVRLGGVASGTGLPTRIRVGIRRTFEATGQINIENNTTLVPDPDRLAMTLLGILDQTPGYDDLIATINSVEELRSKLFIDAGRNPVTDDQTYWFNQTVLLPFIRHYLTEQPDTAWNQALYASIRDDLVAHADGEPMPVRILSPLTHVTAPDVDRIEVSEDTAFVRMTDEEVSDFYDRFGPNRGFGSIDIMDLIAVTHAIEHDAVQDAANPIGMYDEMSTRATPDLVTALRLLREGGAAIAFSTTTPKRRAFGFGFGGMTSPLGTPRFSIGGNTNVEPGDAATLRSLFESLRSMQHGDNDSERRFDLALSRINTAAGRTTHEDQLLDFWVALETLFANDSRGEIGFRIRTRVPRYVSDDFDERRRLSDVLGRSYDRRSKVVHGDKPKADLADLTKETGEILRRAFRALLEARQPIDTEKLDLGRGGQSPPRRRRRHRTSSAW